LEFRITPSVQTALLKLHKIQINLQKGQHATLVEEQVYTDFLKCKYVGYLGPNPSRNTAVVTKI
jgi:hypothetical protein